MFFFLLELIDLTVDGKWTALQSAIPQYSHAFVAANGALYAFGGCNEVHQHELNDLFYFNIGKALWKRIFLVCVA